VIFEKLRVCHDSTNENYLKATVLNHPMIFRGPGNKLTLDPTYLDIADDPDCVSKIAKITVEQCYGQNGFLSRQSFYFDLQINLSVLGYANLGRSLNHFINRLSINRLNDGTCISLSASYGIKKPGKKIRAGLVKRRQKPFNLESQTTCKTFFRLTGIDYVGNEIYAKIISLWTFSGFTNRFKMFVFKFYNNILGINTRTSHFGTNITRYCFFCTKMNPPSNNDESFEHLFFSCQTTQEWQRLFLIRCFPELPALTITNKKELWFLGLHNGEYSVFIAAAFILFQFCIWEEKLKRKRPSFHTIFFQYLELLKLGIKHNSKLRRSGSKLNFSLCRTLSLNRRDE